MSPIENQDLTARFLVAGDWVQLEEFEGLENDFDYVVIPVEGRYAVVPRAMIWDLTREHLDAPLTDVVASMVQQVLVFDRNSQGVGAAERAMHREAAPFGIVIEDEQVVGILVDESRGEHRRAGRQFQETAEAGETDELFLQAIVEELAAGGAAITRTDGFARGGRHRLSVNLSTAAAATGVVADQPVPLDLAVPHALTVSFFAPWLQPTAPQLIMTEPGQAATAPATVECRLPPDLERVAINIAIHEVIDGGQKLIQTGVLGGDAVEPGAQGAGLALLVDPAPARPTSAEAPDLSLVLDDASLAAYARNPDALVRIPGDVSEFRARLGVKVLDLWVEVDAARLDNSAPLDASLARALAKLATKGRDVWDVVNRYLNTDSATKKAIMKGGGAIQLVTRDLDTDLPLEFIYDGEKPDLGNPRLCSHYAAGLKEGACRKCPDQHQHLCPFDFWGLRRRIERRVVAPGDALPNTKLRIGTATDTLPIDLKPAMFGASSRLEEPGRRLVREALEQVGAPVASAVDDWAAWTEGVANDNPSLLALLAHSEQTDEITLEMEGQKWHRAWIDESFVNATKREPGPIVLLTGCETARPDVGFLSFVSKFLDSGAAVVVGTLALIAEDASARATSQILRATKKVIDSDLAVGQRSMGEIMRRTRCRLLAEGDLTGFNLVAYGDADWKFAPGGAP